MAFVIDMHVHTSFGSGDSVITPKHLGERAPTLGLSGVAVTEHNTAWPDDRVLSLREESGLFVYSAREWATEYGHILVLGLNGVRYLPSVRELRQAVLDAGGMMIIAHPFRYFPGPMSLLFGGVKDAARMTPAQLAEHPVFSLVDEIEVVNYGCTERENRLALQVARVLGKRGTAGSDAHSLGELARCVTVFDQPITSDEDLLRELRAGRFYAAQRGPDGQFIPFYNPETGD